MIQRVADPREYLALPDKGRTVVERLNAALERGYRRIDARLSINASATLALFLIETWERQQHRALPLRQEVA